MKGYPPASSTWTLDADGVQTIGGVIAQRAAKARNAPALVGLDAGNISFSQLDSSISLFAGELANAGLARDDRVGLLVPTGVPGGQLVVALASNITLVPLNPRLTEHELREFFKVSGLKAVVVPRWLDVGTRPAIMSQGLTVLDAVRAADGSLALELMTPAPDSPAPLRAARDTDVALLLRSSGTTGGAKLIPVTHRNLLAMAAKLGSDLWFNLTAADRAACTLPLYYAAGLKTTLFVPLLLGASVSFPPEGHAADLVTWVNVLRPTYLSVSPGLLNGIIDRLRSFPHNLAGSSLRFVMCAAAYLPEAVRVTAQQLLGVPVLEFYGLSEAGVMAANPVAPGKAKPETVGVPAPEELVIVDDNMIPVSCGGVGQIAISGPTVTPGYLATTDDAGGDLFKDGWLLTGDLGRIDEDGYLTIVGRVKEVINRGGEKVFPYEIERVMFQHPAVLDAAVFGVQHPRLGENVAAAAVLQPGSTTTEQELKEFLAARLSVFKLPRRVWLVSSLPRGNTGKVLRNALSLAYAAAPREVAEPDGLLELELCSLWSRLLGTNEIGIDDDFFETGGDSLLATEMLMEVELLTGKAYPQSELSTFTIRRMAEVLTSNIAAKRELITQVKEGSGIPLFFCHGDYLDGGIYAHKLAALLADDQPVYLLHCPAHPSAEWNVEDMAGVYLNEVLRAAPGTPVLIAGYCNGGLAAWQLAHLLRSRAVDVVEVILIETISLNARPGLRRLAGFFEMAGSFMPGRAGKFVRQDVMRAVWILKRKGVVELSKLLISSAGRRGPRHDPRRVAAQQTDKLYYGMMSRYVPPPLDVGATCIVAEEGNHSDTDPTQWRTLAIRVEQASVPGTHLSALVDGRQALAQLLGEALRRASARYLMRTVDRGTNAVQDRALSMDQAPGTKPAA